MRIPFVGPAYRLESVNQSAQRCVNLYLEQSEQGGKTPAMLVRTPGKVLRVNLGNDPVRQMLPFGNYVYAVSGYGVYRINSSYAATKIGEISTRTGFVSMATNGQQVIIVDGVAGWIVNVSAGALTQIASSFPNGVTWVRYTDGYFIVGGDGSKKFYVSALNDGLTWNALDFYSAEADPGANIAGEVDHREVFLFGETLTEVWIDTGSNDAQFQRAGNALIEVGCAAVGSVVKLDNSLFFLGRDKRGDGIVYRMNGYTPQRISDFGIEYAISGYSTISDAVAFAYQQRGHLFYILHFPTGGQTWAYDCSTQSWHQRAHLNQQTGEDERDLSNCYAFFNRDHLVGDYASGRIYALDKDVYTDNGDVIRWLRSTVPQDSQNNFVFYQSFELDMQAGVGYIRTDTAGGVTSSARPTIDYEATHTDTTVSPNATLSSAKTFKISGAFSANIDILASGLATASLTDTAHVGGDSIFAYMLVLCNSSATAQQIEKLMNGDVNVPGLNLIYIKIYPTYNVYGLGAFNSTHLSEVSGTVNPGDTVQISLDYSTGNVTATSGGVSIGPQTLNLATIAGAGQKLKLFGGVLSGNNNVVFSAGHVTVDFSGFQQTTAIVTTVTDIDLKVMLRWSNDGGHTWSNRYQMRIGKIGQYSRRAKREQLGAGRNRVWEVSGSDPVPMAIMGAVCRLTPSDR